MKLSCQSLSMISAVLLATFVVQCELFTHLTLTLLIIVITCMLFAYQLSHNIYLYTHLCSPDLPTGNHIQTAHMQPLSRILDSRFPILDSRFLVFFAKLLTANGYGKGHVNGRLHKWECSLWGARAQQGYILPMWMRR